MMGHGMEGHGMEGVIRTFWLRARAWPRVGRPVSLRGVFDLLCCAGAMSMSMSVSAQSSNGAAPPTLSCPKVNTLVDLPRTPATANLPPEIREFGDQVFRDSGGERGWHGLLAVAFNLSALSDSTSMTAKLSTGSTPSVTCIYPINQTGVSPGTAGVAKEAWLQPPNSFAFGPPVADSVNVALYPNQSEMPVAGDPGRATTSVSDLLKKGLTLKCSGANCLLVSTAGASTTRRDAAGRHPYADYEVPGCQRGTRCWAVDYLGGLKKNWQSDPQNTFVAQCSGRFPDYIVKKTDFDQAVALDPGPARFVLSQQYPQDPVTAAQSQWSQKFSNGSAWHQIDFHDPDRVDDYMLAVRDYIFGDDFQSTGRVDWNTPSALEHWFHAPLMNFNPTKQKRVGTREFLQGMTRERGLAPNKLLGNTAALENYAVSYYNVVGSHTLSKVWGAGAPGKETANVNDVRFPVDTVAFKVLYTLGPPSVFPLHRNAFCGAPTRTISVEGKNLTAYLLQMDIAVRDDRASETGWVFGTFAYKSGIEQWEQCPSSAGNFWDRMQPVGLMWSNDNDNERETQGPLGKGVKVGGSIFSNAAPIYATKESGLGHGKRMNGPVDNPDSSCLSCHSTAQSPSAASMESGSCRSESQFWFRTLARGEAFGRAKRADSTVFDLCETTPASGQSLDYSLQTSLVAEQLDSFGQTLTNPCTLPGAQIDNPSVTIPQMSESKLQQLLDMFSIPMFVKRADGGSHQDESSYQVTREEIGAAFGSISKLTLTNIRVGPVGNWGRLVGSGLMPGANMFQCRRRGGPYPEGCVEIGGRADAAGNLMMEQLKSCSPPYEPGIYFSALTADGRIILSNVVDQTQATCEGPYPRN